tara:strand:+ start:220 stop:1467 length:1248 start_codon:yes stop_codon:yes gene_type:complete
MHKLFNELFLINRSLAGDENRKTLNILKKYNKELKINSFKSGGKIENWKIPNEWKIKDAYILNSKGKRVIDYKDNFLHVASYSIPFKGYLNCKELKKKLFTKKNSYDAIPYKTLYYSNDWGFCVSKKQLKNFFKDSNERFFICIDSSFKKGKMDYGEVLLRGRSKREIIFSTYICHPNLANNELSGPVLASELINKLKKKRLRYTLRFLFLTETVGAIAYINKNFDDLKKNFLAGYILTCVAGPGKLSLLKSKYGNSLSDKYAIKTLKELNLKFKELNFLNRGSDERQYSWPNTNLQFSSIMQSKYGDYREYHSSLDNLNFINKKSFELSLKVYDKIINNINSNYFPKSTTKFEPKMDKYVDYEKNYNEIKNILNFLSYCDGMNDLSYITSKIKINNENTLKIFNFCLKKKLISI